MERPKGSEDSKKQLTNWQVALIIVGSGLLLLAIIGLIVFVVLRYKKSKTIQSLDYKPSQTNVRSKAQVCDDLELAMDDLMEDDIDNIDLLDQMNAKYRHSNCDGRSD
jgi:hypothetical protein